MVARPSMMDLADLAVAGDGAATAMLAQRARIAGRAAAVLFDFVNPDVLVVTEIGTNWLPECVDALRAEVAAASSLCTSPELVLPSSFGADVLGVAAGAVQLTALYADPLQFSLAGV